MLEGFGSPDFENFAFTCIKQHIWILGVSKSKKNIRKTILLDCPRIQMYCFSIVFIKFYVVGGNQKPKNLAVSAVFLNFRHSQDPNVLFYAGKSNIFKIRGTETFQHLKARKNLSFFLFFMIFKPMV